MQEMTASGMKGNYYPEIWVTISKAWADESSWSIKEIRVP